MERLNNLISSIHELTIEQKRLEEEIETQRVLLFDEMSNLSIDHYDDSPLASVHKSDEVYYTITPKSKVIAAMNNINLTGVDRENFLLTAFSEVRRSAHVRIEWRNRDIS